MLGAVNRIEQCAGGLAVDDLCWGQSTASNSVLEVWQSMTCAGGVEDEINVPIALSAFRDNVLGAVNRIEQCAGGLAVDDLCWGQ